MLHAQRNTNDARQKGYINAATENNNRRSDRNFLF